MYVLAGYVFAKVEGQSIPIKVSARFCTFSWSEALLRHSAARSKRQKTSTKYEVAINCHSDFRSMDPS